MYVRYGSIIFLLIFIFLSLAPTTFAQATPTPCVAAGPNGELLNCIIVDQNKLGFTIPTLSDILTFAIRLIFVIGGLAALVFLLLGAFSWITSGGDKDRVSAAMQKIQAAVLGVIMIAVVLAIVVTLEQVVFNRRICLGLSCPITIPSLLESSGPSQLVPANQSETNIVLPLFTSLTPIPPGTAIPPLTSIPIATPLPNETVRPYRSMQNNTNPIAPDAGYAK